MPWWWLHATQNSSDRFCPFRLDEQKWYGIEGSGRCWSGPKCSIWNHSKYKMCNITENNRWEKSHPNMWVLPPSINDALHFVIVFECGITPLIEKWYVWPNLFSRPSVTVHFYCGLHGKKTQYYWWWMGTGRHAHSPLCCIRCPFFCLCLNRLCMSETKWAIVHPTTTNSVDVCYDMMHRQLNSDIYRRFAVMRTSVGSKVHHA